MYDVASWIFFIITYFIPAYLDARSRTTVDLVVTFNRVTGYIYCLFCEKRGLCMHGGFSPVFPGFLPLKIGTAR
jgi:hypothetical protein